MPTSSARPAFWTAASAYQPSPASRCCPPARSYGLGVIPWSPLHGGLLGGIIRKTEKGKRRLTGRAKEPGRAPQGDQGVGGPLRRARRAPRDVGLAWLLHQPAVTAPIIGPRTMEQLERSLRAVDLRLNKDVLTRLDENFPGPGGPAPEAYAW